MFLLWSCRPSKWSQIICNGSEICETRTSDWTKSLLLKRRTREAGDRRQTAADSRPALPHLTSVYYLQVSSIVCIINIICITLHCLMLLSCWNKTLRGDHQPSSAVSRPRLQTRSRNTLITGPRGEHFKFDFGSNFQFFITFPLPACYSTGHADETGPCSHSWLFMQLKMFEWAGRPDTDYLCSISGCWVSPEQLPPCCPDTPHRLCQGGLHTAPV